MCVLYGWVQLLWVNAESFLLMFFSDVIFFWYMMPSSEFSLSKAWLRGSNQYNEIFTRSIPAILTCCVNTASFWLQHILTKIDCLWFILLTSVALALKISSAQRLQLDLVSWAPLVWCILLPQRCVNLESTSAVGLTASSFLCRGDGSQSCSCPFPWHLACTGFISLP